MGGRDSLPTLHAQEVLLPFTCHLPSFYCTQSACHWSLAYMACFPGHPQGSWGQGTPPFPGVSVSKAMWCSEVKPTRCRQGEEYQAHCLRDDSPQIYQVEKSSLVQCWMLLVQPTTAKPSEAACRYVQCYSLRKRKRLGPLYSSCGLRPQVEIQPSLGLSAMG